MACEDEVCCQEIFIGDEGLPIQFHVHTCDETTTPRTETPLDISDATSLDIKFLKPDGSYTAVLVGSFATDGTDGLVQYVTLDTTLDQEGNWKGQLEVDRPSGKKATSIIKFKVYKKL